MSPVVPRVLVVDDHDDSRHIYTNYLRFMGFEVEAAADGGEGVELCRSFAPAVIVLDLLMPVVDGWEAIRQIKSEEGCRDAAIIVVSADRRPEHEQLAKTYGCDAFYQKPLSPSDLHAAIVRVLDSKAVR
jgi:CheY-like chemotaxis protein